MKKRTVLRSVVGAAVAALALVLSGTGYTAEAQDTRAVTEPVIPPACTVLQARQAIVSGEPASETSFDTNTIQTALNAAVTSCGTGYGVELTTNGTNNAFLIGPLTIPAGVTLVVDGGVTVFGSRNPADYQVSTAGAETCGTVGTSGNGCNALIASTGSNSGIMGYGIIDGRGQDKLLVNGTAASYSWWDQAGTAQNVSGSQNNPILVQANGANFTIYKITFRNSPMFHVKWSGNTTTRTGFTAWGVKVVTPFTARNSDGIDPSGGNITVTNSSISDGDDMVAVSAASTAQNITIQNLNTYSGHGISVGSYTQGNLSNMLVQNITQMGTAADGNGGGLRIKTSQDRGGLVQNVTYQNICSANVKSPIYLSPYYNTNAGTSYPNFSNITYRNVHVVTEGTITLTGYANTGATVTRPATLTFDNFIIDTLKQTDFSPNPPAYLTITRGPGPASSLLLSQTGTGVTYTGAVTNPTAPPYACNPSTFQYLVGELYGSTASATNLQSAGLTTNGTVTLTAMLQPAMSQVTYASISGQGSYTGTPSPTAQVQFKEGTRIVGSASLGGNGTIASVTLNGLTPGTHTYTAFYAGDSTYTVPLAFGSVLVTVTQAVPTTTTLTATPSGTITYGASTTLSATISGGNSTNSSTPSGQVVFVDNGTAQLATVGMTSSPAQTAQVLGAGSHSLQAIYSGDTTYAASTSTALPVTVTQATPAILLAPTSASFAYGGSTTLAATVAPSGSGSTPTGSVVFYDGTTIVGSGTLSGAGAASTLVTPAGGSHTYTAKYQGDANYTAVASTVTGVSVTAVSTTTALAVSGSTSYGSTTTLAATVAPGSTGTPALPGGTVTFYDGTTPVGSGTLSGTTVTATALLSQGTHSLTAKYAGDGNFAASTSVAASLTMSAPLVLSPALAALSLPVGGSGTVNLTVAPAGGFTGAVALTCASPASYIACSVTPSSPTITGTTAVSATLSIQVASVLSRLEVPERLQPHNQSRFFLAMLAPFGALAFAGKRKGWRGVLPCVLLLILFPGLSGCSGPSSSSAPSTSNLPPTGTQVVTVTATAGLASSFTSVSVTITH